MSSNSVRNDRVLRMGLRANAVFSGLSGIVFLVGFNLIGSFIGVVLPVLFILLGVGLLLFSLSLFRMGAQSELNPQEAVVVSLMDIGWVLGSIILLVWPNLPITLEGRWLIAIVADIVAIFAIWQLIGIRRLKMM